VRAGNLADSPTRFLIDPRDHIEARRRARRRGLEVVGFYHSHPHSPPRPSSTDVAESTYTEAVQLIVSLQGAIATTGLFQIAGGSVTQLALVPVD
jgi:proteasome lid subunit RPN8/RPN11